MNEVFQEINVDDESDLVPTSKGKYHISHGDDERFWGNRGAGILLIASDSKRLLLVLRSRHVNEPGTWGIPGGKIDSDSESPKSAALREAKEELGYVGPIKIIPAHVFSAGKFRFHNFIGIVPTEFTPSLDWENDDADWFEIDNLPSPLHFGIKSLLSNSKEEIADIIVS